MYCVRTNNKVKIMGCSFFDTRRNINGCNLLGVALVYDANGVGIPVSDTFVFGCRNHATLLLHLPFLDD